MKVKVKLTSKQLFNKEGKIITVDIPNTANKKLYSIYIQNAVDKFVLKEIKKWKVEK